MRKVIYNTLTGKTTSYTEALKYHITNMELKENAEPVYLLDNRETALNNLKNGISFT